MLVRHKWPNESAFVNRPKLTPSLPVSRAVVVSTVTWLFALNLLKIQTLKASFL